MNNQSNNYLSFLDTIKNNIENYPLKLTSGTKKMLEEYNHLAIEKRNNYVKSLIESFTQEAEIIKKVLTQKADSLMATANEESINSYKEQLTLLETGLNYANEYKDSVDKVGLSEIIHKIDNVSEINLSTINNHMLKVINIFKEAGITLTLQDFNYSNYTAGYMDLFLKSMVTDNFAETMKEEFNKIYWSCPTILTHLKLNIYRLVKKYQKQFDKYCMTKNTNFLSANNMTVESLENRYIMMAKELDKLIYLDKHLNTEKFLSKELSITDYIPSSAVRKSRLNYFLKDKEFDTLEESEKEKYLTNVIELGDSIDEFENYNKYVKLIKDVVNRYNNKATAKKDYIAKQKAIIKIEKAKDKKLKKCQSAGKFSRDKEKKNNKINELNFLIEEDIKNLNILYKEQEEARINNKIATFIDKGSTIYDALNFIDSFYGYLKNLIIKEFKVTTLEEIDEIKNAFKTFVKDADNIILKRINLFDEINLEDTINNKCQLFEINIEGSITENLEEIKSTISAIKTIYYVEKTDLKFEDINFIFEVRNL